MSTEKVATTAPAAVPSTPTPPSIKHKNPSVPVVLHEAGLDSPSFRSSALYFSEQVDAIERWLEGYVRTTAKLSHDLLAKIIPPPYINNVDNDYAALALKRFSEGSREWWVQILNAAKQMDSMSVEPIRNFLQGDLRNFKEARRILEQTQKAFDTTLARYVSQSKAKEPSSLREDAFAVYETRKAYLKASMDFCFYAPQFRINLDKLIVQVSYDLWREMKKSRDAAGSFGKHGHEMDRVRGWAKEMELSEPTFKRQLQLARSDIGESALAAVKPSREIEDYSASTVPFLGSKGPLNVTTAGQSAAIMEKQGWLYLRTLTGKPSRTNWIRRWYYCRDGIFGWLVNSPQGVLQGDEIGVLLCNAKPAVGEERRFCFEVKTKNQTLLLQAETQSQLMEWLEVFEVAKKKAFEASVSRDNSSLPGGVDPAFSITPPSLPEFSAKALDAQIEDSANAERAGALSVPAPEVGLIPRPSFDLTTAPPKRSVTSLAREEGESSREHAARIMQKLDLHRRAFTSGLDTGPVPAPGTSGGIAGLISASHGLLPGYTGAGSKTSQQLPGLSGPEAQPGSLAPATLAKPPATTNLSKTAVVYSGDRVFSSNSSQYLPTAILANYWGSNAWGREYSKASRSDVELEDPFGPNSPTIKMVPVGDGEEVKSPSSHKKAISMDARMNQAKNAQPAIEKPPPETFPANYPIELKTNSAQFRLLFPNVPLDEKLVLVFRASWISNSEDDRVVPTMAGNGRIYVTPDNMYFYGHQMDLVVTYTISLDTISEVTAAPGRDCDFIFLHLNQGTDVIGYTRVTIKTFLEDLDLLHSRLNLLVDDLQAEEPMDVPELIKALINLEKEEQDRKSPSMDSWEEISEHTPLDDGTAAGRAISPRSYDKAYKSRRKISRKPLPKFQLPTNPVIYEPEGMQRKGAERNFEISAKACFHVLFGDKSFIFPKLYFESRAQHITQSPWKLNEAGNMQRQFRFSVNYTTRMGRTKAEEYTDEQTIDLFSDHVTYVVTHVKTPWHLPHAHGFKLVTKIVITHVAKSKCKLAIFTKVVWTKPPALAKNLVEQQALDDAGQSAEDLAEVATDQVRKLGHHSRTKRAIQVYGNVGQQTQALVFTPNEADMAKKALINPRTLSQMLLETLRSFADSVASSLMMWAFAAIKKLWDVVTAQWIILGLLAFSMFTNVVFSGQGTSTWWSERRAVGFMNRIGVGPNVVMSKAIYIADLDEAAHGSAGLQDWPEHSYCYSTFKSIANGTDADAPSEQAGAAMAWSSSRATARRLRQTRQKLGSYRHDLLVAMRTVNSVEREVVRAEWENWLLDENHRCEKVEAALARWDDGGVEKGASNGAGGIRGWMSRGEGQEVVKGEKGERERDEAKRRGLQAWYEEYCGSFPAFKALAPVNWDDIAHDSLETFLEEVFNDAQCILDSIPVSSSPSTQKIGRPRSSSKTSDRASELRKDWKEAKVNPRENPLGLDVYKLAAKDGKGAWFARRSVHDILTFAKWKLGMEKELDESMKVQGKPGDGSIRGIGADKKVVNQIVEGRGRMQVYQLSAQFPGPTTPRDFITLLLSSDSAIDIPGTPKHYMLVSKPCIHPECPPRQGYIRGQYESVEFIREVRVEKPLRKTRSSIDLPNDESAASIRNTAENLGRQASIRSARLAADSASPARDGDGRRRGRTIGHADIGDVMENDEDYDTMVEWIMVTRSDPGGSVPRFMIERGTPPGIAGDANKFVKWISSKSIHDFTESDGEDTKLIQEAEKAEEGLASKKPAPANITLSLTKSPSAPILSAIDEKEEAEEAANPTGFYGMISNALNSAASAAASRLPNPFGSVNDDNMSSSSLSEPPVDDDDASSTRSFHSLEAEEIEENDGSSSKPEESSTQLTPSVTNGGAESMRSTDSLTRSTGTSQHDKELKKLEERKRKTEEKLRRAQEKALAKRGSTASDTTSSQREETALQKLREKHEREVAKQQEKYQRELKKLEAKRVSEQKKTEERRKKTLEREERSTMAMELDKVRAERDIARKQMDILKEQVGELQAQNTMLVARLGREGVLLDAEEGMGVGTPPRIRRAMSERMSERG
ncbi:uncharacterized protein GGS22DRAFT_178533 [Annulohypoxylon maeteangense]|uniref:uncharacterized protein n=1 Tax=Annulohypoxylon maeteangense TaxID=1927788 RepID=UPI002008234A|nr:uncharacterized protein GGS22DRAFT_178533 [Annulohypoxylon maeteangense]KAI0887400.1 hypothetical protein GGS22DRAFT_178533 [Annulohypoxylon maeteangense]